MFAKFFDLVVAPVFNVLAAAILKSDAAKEFLAQSIADRVNAKKIAQHLDYGALHDEIDTNDMYTYVAQHCNVSASDIADHIDIDDITDTIKEGIEVSASDVAEHICLSDLAGELDYSQITNHLEIDYSEIASNLEASDIAGEISVSDIAEEVDMDAVIENLVNNDDCLDYKELAKALIRELGVARTVEVLPGKCEIK
jgi:hypothetical protein